MQPITYDSLKAEQAWMVVSEQLNQRNTLLSRGISHLEADPGELPLASRLMILRYHLRHSLRRLTAEARQLPTQPDQIAQLHRQWMHIHQLHFLLRQIDNELRTASDDSTPFREWLESLELRVYKSALVSLN
jgi:hypothetical protein